MEQKKILGFNRNIFFIGLTSFLTDTSTKMMYSVMPLFLLSIGASKTTISLIEGIAESTSSVLKAISGIWSDKLRKNKPFMLIGYGLTALITPLYLFVGRPLQVLYLRFIERVGKGLRAAPRDSLISGSIDRSETGKSFGLHKAMDNSGAIIGPLFAFILLYYFPQKYTYVFVLATIPALLGVLSIIFFIQETKTRKGTGTGTFSLDKLPIRFYVFLGIIAVFSLGNSTDALLLIKMTETGLKQAYIPFIYMLFNIVSVILAIPTGKLSDKIGRKKLIVLGFLVYALVYTMFGTFNDIGVFIFAFILYGVYSVLTDSCQKAMVSDLISKDLKGTGYGLYHAMLGITLLPASLIAGVLYDTVSSSAPFYFGALMSMFAAILMIIFAIYTRTGQRPLSPVGTHD